MVFTTNFFLLAFSHSLGRMQHLISGIRDSTPSISAPDPKQSSRLAAFWQRVSYGSDKERIFEPSKQ